jgi:arylsulfatase A-like enzyme
VLALLASVALIVGTKAGGALASGGSSTPNVLFIITDDQRLDGTMAVMPKTQQYFETGGTKFTNGFVTTPLCCPSRASIFSGRYVHNHLTRTNDESQALDQRYTIQKYLKDAGYSTGIYGKYFNAWNLQRNPPNFDKWSIFTAGYSPIRVNEQGVVKGVSTYATTYIKDNAINFIQQAEGNDSQPWFLYLATTAPHSPFTPEAQYASASVPAFSPGPSYLEADRTDKPPYVQTDQPDTTVIQNNRTQQLRTLMSVDDMVDSVFQTLENTGEAANTIAVFMSDNGYLWGEHGLEGKGPPYSEVVRVPLYLRWPGHVTAGATDNRLAANVDLAPTVADAVSGVSPAIPMDGRSLLNPTALRSRMLVESNGEVKGAPSWASLFTTGSQYTEYYDSQDFSAAKFREYYDLTQDPYALDNLLSDGNPANDPSTASLAAQLVEDRTCAGSNCP